MKLTVYAYKNCGTCRNALKFLDEHGIPYTVVPIRETPPSPDELRRMLQYQGGVLRRLFNTSGQDYRDLGLKDRLSTMSEDEAIALLAAHGNLVKRPFILGDGFGLLGFGKDEWSDRLL
ncbi:MAG: arsenate reductase family protein [Candidatus Hydrogenedentes bacterium]|nr:arsenate reductase family protein [Candidatus Hydrogenedentota bacterium]